MSPVEGPVTELPPTPTIDPQPERGAEGEEFAGHIVYNPDGSAYILEAEAEELLQQIPTQEGAIVEKAGKLSPPAQDYPRIDQAVYIARRTAWYSAVGTAYLQLMQEKPPDSPIIHNFKVVSVKDKMNTKLKKEDKTSEEMSEGKGP